MRCIVVQNECRVIHLWNVSMSQAPNPIDVHVGSRVRLRRMMIGMSQETLGAKLNLTFQQVQKYEKGANRIGASRLFTIASILDVPVQFFFDDLPEDIKDGPPDSLRSKKSDGDIEYVMNFVGSREGLDLNIAFSKIKDPSQRKAFLALIETLS